MSLHSFAGLAPEDEEGLISGAAEGTTSMSASLWSASAAAAGLCAAFAFCRTWRRKEVYVKIGQAKACATRPPPCRRHEGDHLHVCITVGRQRGRCWALCCLCILPHLRKCGMMTNSRYE